MNRLQVLFFGVFIAIMAFYFIGGNWNLDAEQSFVYILDDVYIHLALARNFAEYGVWSVNTEGFDSASSSILYTLLLSGLMKVFGNWQYFPLIINVFFGFGSIYTVYRYFNDFYSKRELIWAAVLVLPFTLLYYMVLMGMEHTIHIFLITVAVYLIHQNVNLGFRNGKRFFWLLLVTFFISIVRFESVFFTVSLGFALVWRREFVKSGSVLLVGLLPILIFGLISLQNGGFFFPNSVMIKGSYPEQEHFLLSLWHIFAKGILLNPSFYKCLFFPFLLLGFHLIQKYRKSGFKEFLKNETLLIVIVSMSLCHALFSVLKYRYENYVMMAILLITVPTISKFSEKIFQKNSKKSILKFVTAVSIIAIVLISAFRFATVHNNAFYGSQSIADQQIEISKFLSENYRGEVVLANDIGAISYFGGVKLIDLVGLGTTDIAKMEVELKNLPNNQNQNKASIFLRDYLIKKKCKISVIYPEWFPGKIPSNWIPVASWTLKENYGTAMDKVVFYAFNPQDAQKLKHHLQNYKINQRTKQFFIDY